MRLFTIILLLLLSTKSFPTDFSGTLTGALSVNLLLGTQLKAVNFGVSIYGTATYQLASVEGGVNINITPFIQKYGVYQGSFSGTLELFGLIGYGENENLLGSNIGLTKHTAFYDYRIPDTRFYGLGMAIILNHLRGDLKKFQNKQGGLLLRFSDHQNSLAINVTNDVNVGPFAKSGTDKGSTGRVMVSYTTIRDRDLYGFGLGLDMFTPEPDHGNAPRSNTNSEDGSRPVWVNTEPYSDLFHLNLFASFVYQNEEINFDGRFGVDHYKIGAFIQNTLHDSFGLYPRFSWPVARKARFYSLLDFNSTVNNTFSE